MQFNDTTNYTGIIQEVERMTDLGRTYISANADRLKETTATINRVMNRIWHTIFMATGNWQYDDANQTNMPAGKTNLVKDQTRYEKPSEALTIQRIEVDDGNDEWYRLIPTTEGTISGGIESFMDVSGKPMFYTLKGNQVDVYPASDYDQTNGLKIYYDRAGVQFESDDTTEEPGFAAPYHELVPIKTSIEILKVKQPNTPTLIILTQDDLRVEKAMNDFYAKRLKDYKPVISRLKELWR